MGGHARRRASVGLLIVGRPAAAPAPAGSAAYRWFERGILVQIFVTQVFEFTQEQLAGVLGLAFNLLLWIALPFHDPGRARAGTRRARTGRFLDSFG